MKTIISTILISIYTMTSFISYVPQIVKLIRTKQSEDISLASWTLWVVGGITYLGYVCLETRDIKLIAMSIIDALFCITTFVLTKYYQWKNKDSLENNKNKK